MREKKDYMDQMNKSPNWRKETTKKINKYGSDSKPISF